MTLYPQRAVSTTGTQEKQQIQNTTGELDSFMKCLIGSSTLLIIACLSDLGVPPTQDFFQGNDRQRKLLWGCGGDTCPNGFMPTKP
jgi:hypothetical protein